MKKIFTTLCSAALLALAASPWSALATTQFWSPTGTVGATGGLWDTSTANWSNIGFVSGGGATWVQGNDASFTIVGTVNVTVNTAITVGNVTFIGTAGTATVLQSTTGTKQLGFPTGSFNIDTANRTILCIASSGNWDFIGTATTTLTKKGTGTMSLSSMAGTYAGKWVISEGWLSIGTTSSLQWFGGNAADDAVTLNTTSAGGITCSGGIRTISGNGFNVGANGGAIRCGTSAAVSIDVKSKITGSGVLSCNTSGTTVAANLLILDNAANTFNGTFAISSAITRVGVAGAMQSGASVLMNPGGTTTTLDFNGQNTTIKTISGTGGSVDLNGATVTLDNPAGEVFAPATAVKSTIAGGKFVKNGSGAITFSVSSGTYDGGVTVNNGTLKIGTNPSLGTGKLTMAGAGGPPKFSAANANARAPANAVDISSDCTFGDSVNTGTLTFGTGAWRLVGGDRQITVDTTTLTINGSAVLGNDGSARALTKAGSGTLVLGTASTYGGDTTVSAGKLEVDNTTGSGTGSGNVTVQNLATLAGNGTISGTVTVQSGGTLAPGTSAIGTLSLGSAPSLGGGLNMRINKTGLASDKLNLTSGTLNLGGTLTVTVSGTAPTGGETFTLFTGSINSSSSFTSITEPTPPSGFHWDNSQLAVNGTITLASDCTPPSAGPVAPSSQTVCAGSPASFSVSATGTAPLHYQWRKNGTINVGTDSSSYTIASTVTGDAGTYDCVVSGQCSPTSTATAGTLAVNAQPAAPDATYSRAPGTQIKIKISDLTSDSVTVLGSGSQSATITKDSTYIYYIPQAGNNNNDVFTYTTSNGSCTKTGNLTVNVVTPGGIAKNIAYSPSGVTVTFAGIPAQSYEVQRADDIGFTVNLTSMGITNAPSGGIWSIFDPSPPNPSGYYRTKQN